VLPAGDEQWRSLSDGIEYFWRPESTLLAWHFSILIVLSLALLMCVLVTPLLDARMVWMPITCVIPCACLTARFGQSVVAQWRGQPSRLRATFGDGVRLWRWAKDRPELSIRREIIAELTLERDWLCEWQLVVILKRGWRRRRVLFIAERRDRLERIRRSLRSALRIGDDEGGAGPRGPAGGAAR
jgi:hypothetical protein